MQRKRAWKWCAVTNHAPAIPDSAHIWHFVTMKELPDYIRGSAAVRGCEANILDRNGTIDMKPEYLKSMEVVVASIHPPCYEDGDMEDHTETWLNVIKNPYVNILGHSGDSRFPYDIDRVVRAAKENNKCIEINNHSYSVRKHSIPNCRKIAWNAWKWAAILLSAQTPSVPFDVGSVAKRQSECWRR